MIWQLLQVRKLSDCRSCWWGAMWQGLVDWHRQVDAATRIELVSAPDIAIPQVVPGAEEAIVILRESHAAWTRARDTQTD